MADPSINTGDAAGDTYIGIEGLIGTKKDDVLYGDSGNNFLDGGGGADALHGGSGVDRAWYNSSTVGLTVSLADPSINTGDAAGDAYDSIEALVGSNFNDVLIGDAGNNFLNGMGGSDTLRGNDGDDGFVFSAALGPGNIDSIEDFAPGQDKILLQQDTFQLPAGVLDPTAFFGVGGKETSSTRIIYDGDTGALYYDSDGTGANEPVQFATLGIGLPLTYADFSVFL